MKVALRHTLQSIVLMATVSHAAASRAACGDGIVDRQAFEECDDGAPSTGDGCSSICTVECLQLGTAVIEHTCLHGSFGPFADRVAVAWPGPATSNLNPAHTYYTVALPPGSAETRSLVSFRPAARSAFAIFTKERYPLRVVAPNGEEVPVRFEHAVSSCAVRDSLTWVRVYPDFERALEYTLELGPWPGTTMSLALESLGFERRLFSDGDRDGWGSARVVADTWCAPLLGWSEHETDCDDTDPTSHPGARELCDGRNNDCDGRGDETDRDACEGAVEGARCLVSISPARCGCATDTDCLAASKCIEGRCNEAGDSGPDSGSADSGTAVDAGPFDAALPDADLPRGDAAPQDAGSPRDIDPLVDARGPALTSLQEAGGDCSCRVARSASPSAAHALAVVMVGAAASLRRRGRLGSAA